MKRYIWLGLGIVSLIGLAFLAHVVTNITPAIPVEHASPVVSPPVASPTVTPEVPAEVVGEDDIAVAPQTFSYWWLQWLLGAGIVVLLGEWAINKGGLHPKITRGVTFTLGVVLTIAGLYSLFGGVSIGNPITGISSLMSTLGLDPTSGLSWALLWGMVTIAGAYLWGLGRAVWDGTPFWTKLTFGIVTAVVVLMLLGWLGRMGAESVLGEELTQQIVDGTQTSLQDGARSLVREDGRTTLKPLWDFLANIRWGIFIGWVFIGIIVSAMVILLMKGNKLITIPLGVAGLILFLVVGGYQAYKLEPVGESFRAVGSGLSTLSLPANGLGGRQQVHEINLTVLSSMVVRGRATDQFRIQFREGGCPWALSARFTERFLADHGLQGTHPPSSMVRTGRGVRMVSIPPSTRTTYGWTDQTIVEMRFTFQCQ